MFVLENSDVCTPFTVRAGPVWLRHEPPGGGGGAVTVIAVAPLLASEVAVIVVDPGAVPVAVRVFVRGAVPSVQLPTVATPSAVVVWDAPVMLPLPEDAAEVT